MRHMTRKNKRLSDIRRKSRLSRMKRDKYILNLHGLGYNNVTIGNTFNISRERVRQILYREKQSDL